MVQQVLIINDKIIPGQRLKDKVSFFSTRSTQLSEREPVVIRNSRLNHCAGRITISVGCMAKIRQSAPIFYLFKRIKFTYYVYMKNESNTNEKEYCYGNRTDRRVCAVETE